MTRARIDPGLLRRRARAERRFRFYGQAALGLSVLLLVLLLGSILWRAAPGFLRAEVRLDITLDSASLPADSPQAALKLPPSAFLLPAYAALAAALPDAPDAAALRERRGLLSLGAGLVVKQALESGAARFGRKNTLWLPLASDADMALKNHPDKLTARQVSWLDNLRLQASVRQAFNTQFFARGNSRAPEKAGFLGAAVGSLLTLAICLAVAFPLGVASAIYLEEFAKPGKFSDLVEVNINNLAAVPSIVFGLLGLALYINVLGMPRSAPLVGGLTLALMILPVIIIAGRAAIRSVPASIRDAARALGASPVQVVWHQVLPLSLPGILTGTILGLARAIGETAPLLLIGMVAFVADIPRGFTDTATVMPVQIYLWASSPEAGFGEKTAAGILTLLVILLALNALAIFLRKRFEIRW